MSRIGQTFTALKAHNKKALIIFITAGDPGKGLTVPLMHVLVEAGADIIELGVPFSDPMADGPVIQRASDRGRANMGGLRDVLMMTA
jgi:tryptophan synthase alpha chain